MPFNPYLLLKYDAHICVDVVSGLRSVKYLYKVCVLQKKWLRNLFQYCYKGLDRAQVETTTDDELIIDEIGNTLLE